MRQTTAKLFKTGGSQAVRLPGVPLFRDRSADPEG